MQNCTTDFFKDSPDRLNAPLLAKALGCSTNTARKHILEMNHVNVGTGSKRGRYWITTDDARKRFCPNALRALRAVK